MLLLWKTNKLGKIWLDGEAVKQLIAKRLPNDLYVQSVSLVGEEDLLDVTVAVSDEITRDTKTAVEEKIRGFFARTHITAKVKWLTTAPQENKKTTPVWTMPIFWAAAGGGLTGLFHMGIKGILWSIFTAVVAYGISWMLITEDGRKQIAALQEHFRR